MSQKEPFDFRWCYEDENGREDCGVLLVGDPSEVPPLSIHFKNILEDENEIITIISGKDSSVCPDYYHFKFPFPVGILNKPDSIEIDEGWDIFVESNDEADTLYLLWKGADEAIPPNEERVITLKNVAAQPEKDQQKADLTISIGWKKINDKDSLINTEENLVERPRPPEYTETFTLDLEMKKTTGKSNIPLFVGFVNCNKVFNTADEADLSSLTLRVTNTNLGTDPSNNVTLKYDASDSSNCSTLRVLLEVGEKCKIPWALGTKDQVNGITITAQKSDGESSEWNVSGPTGQPNDETARALEWVLTPNEEVVLAAQETLLITLDSIITGHPSGQTNLYLQYQNIDEYADGQFICQIEKAPVRFDNTVQVGKDAEIKTGNSFTFNASTDPSISSPKTFALFQNNGKPIMQLDEDDSLNFGRQYGDLINFFDETEEEQERKQYSIGIQHHSMFFRTYSHFAWYRRGTYDDTTWNPGPDGLLQMRLDENGCLAIGDHEAQATLDVDGGALFNGNVSIGTSDSENKLDVKGNIQLTGGDKHTIYTDKKDDEEANYSWMVGAKSNYFYIWDHKNKRDCLNINNEGNVGIATNDPQSKLHVNGDLRVDKKIRGKGGNALFKIVLLDEENNTKDIFLSDSNTGLQEFSTNMLVSEWGKPIPITLNFNAGDSFKQYGMSSYIHEGEDGEKYWYFEIMVQRYHKPGKFYRMSRIKLLFIRKELFGDEV